MTRSLLGVEERGAVLSELGQYRYRLWRVWEAAAPRVLFVMLNPSTADAQADDPTIRRCIRYATDWGYGALEVVNLFAFRAPDPARLYDEGDPVGPENDEHILSAAARCQRTVCAWGRHGGHLGRADVVRRLLVNDGRALCHLGLNDDGSPKHPLYLRRERRPEAWA